MDYRAVGLGRALGHVATRLQHSYIQVVPRQLARDSAADDTTPNYQYVFFHCQNIISNPNGECNGADAPSG